MNVYFHEAVAPLLVPIDSVWPNGDNENSNDTDAIVESIATNGFYSVVLATPEGRLVAGHGRYAALLELGATEIPVIRVSPATEDAEARIRLADNRTTRLGRDDPSLMLKTLEALLLSDDGLRGTGYQDNDVEILRLSLEGPLEFDEEEFAKQRSGHVCICPACGWTSEKGR